MIVPHIRNVTVTATTAHVIRRNKNRRTLLIYNNEESNIPEITSGEPAPYGQGIPIPPKRDYHNFGGCQGSYYLLCDTGETADVRIEEGIEV